MARGRPKGSKNKPKDAAPDGAATDAGPGHNSSAGEGLTEDQLQKRFFQHVREYRRELDAKKTCDDAKREQDAVFKNLCKRIKGEGSSVEDIKTHLELQSPEGEEKMRTRMEAQLRIARWNGLALGTQTDLFAGVDRTPSVDIAFDDGKRDGLMGNDFANKYAPGTAQYGRYRDGYSEGQAVNLDGIKQKPEETAGPAPDSDEQFDDSTADNPSRRRQPDPTDGAEGAGTYTVA